MKRSKLVVFLMLLSLAFSWFVWVGVASAENPWDADSPGTTSSSDTSTAPTADSGPADNGTVVGDGLDSFQHWLVQYLFMAYLQSIGISPAPAVASNGGKSQTTTTSVRK